MNVPIIGQQESGPKCPECNTQPVTMDIYTGTFPNGIIASVVHCHDCGHILPAFMCGAVQREIVPPGPKLVS